MVADALRCNSVTIGSLDCLNITKRPFTEEIQTL